MSYSEVDIVNLGLLQIGALPIAALTDVSPNGVKCNKIWTYIRDEVLQARDWRFAVTRVELSKNSNAPLYTYSFSYTIPTDFLRLKRWKENKNNSSNYISVFDPPVYPPGFPYIIEALTDGTLCLMTDYDNADDPIYISYVKRETNAARYSPTFITALSLRLAAALAIPITESAEKFKGMMGLYQAALKSAEAVNESYDFIADETGSSSWEKAGR